MIFVEHKNVKERVNFIDFERKLESVYFDESFKIRAFIYFKILPLIIEYRILQLENTRIL